MLSSDADENGILDGIQWGCDDFPTGGGPLENDTTDEGNTTIEEEEEDSGFINIREDAMSRPGAGFLFGLIILSVFSLAVSAWISFRKPANSNEEILNDD